MRVSQGKDWTESQALLVLPLPHKQNAYQREEKQEGYMAGGGGWGSAEAKDVMVH